MKQTAVEFIVEQLDCLNRERKDKLIDAETYFKNKTSLIIQAKEMEKQQKGYSDEDMKSAFKIGFSIGYGSDVHAIDEKNRTCEEWFEQFKKK